MTKWRDQPYHRRKHSLGDEAETVWQNAHPLGQTCRFGWNRPTDQNGKEIRVGDMDLMWRHMPDYYAAIGALVEVAGCGRDGLLKSIKPDKYEGLKLWAKLCRQRDQRLLVFVWNSHAEQYALLEWPDVVALVKAARRRGVKQFNDGNEYFEIPWVDVAERASVVGAWNTQ